MEDQQITQVFQNAATKEAEAYDLFKKRFETEFPAPKQPNVRLMEAIGWQFIVILIQCAFAIVLASLRTADMFYIAASSTNFVVQWGTAISAIGAIEFGVVVFATIKSEIENRKTEIQDLKSALKVDVNLLRTGIYTGVFISVIAGLGVSFKGFGIEWDGFAWALSIVMGAGASIIAWVSGDIMGAMLARLNNSRALATLEYTQELTARMDKMRDMWERAPERGIARSELTEMQELLRASRFKAQPRKQAPQIPVVPGNGGGVREQIFAYINARASADFLPGPTEISQALKVSKGYASDMIKAWRADNNYPDDFPMSETADNAQAE